MDRGENCETRFGDAIPESVNRIFRQEAVEAMRQSMLRVKWFWRMYPRYFDRVRKSRHRAGD